MGFGAIWGFSNASQELFFYDLGSSSVTSAQVITGLSGHLITGVAYQMSTGDIYLSGYTGLNSDTLFHIASSATAATTVGSMFNDELASYFVDLEFGADGRLYTVSFIHQLHPSLVLFRFDGQCSDHLHLVQPVSSGPHRDGTTSTRFSP